VEVKRRILAMYVLLAAINIVAWILAFTLFHSRPALIAAALLAYTFGLRHAVDADHISAIDNVTRKLMQEGQRPVGTGFYFSLGHSTIVVLLSAAIVLGAGTMRHAFPALQNVGGLIGTSISALFLYLIAAINFVVLIQVVRAFRAVRRGDDFDQQSIDEFLLQRGMIGRFCRPLIRLCNRSWHMYPLGLLFGLGFDTATEVGLLGIAAIEASKGLPIMTILIFPLLFTASMSLVDTTDGILMLGAYGWALITPVRKLYYNMNVTLISVAVALFVGTVEFLSIFNVTLNAKGVLWNAVAILSTNFGRIGFLIVGAFALCWAVSALVYKYPSPSSG
jgi:high-affinity nickel-transport protein